MQYMESMNVLKVILTTLLVTVLQFKPAHSNSVISNSSLSRYSVICYQLFRTIFCFPDTRFEIAGFKCAYFVCSIVVSPLFAILFCKQISTIKDSKEKHVVVTKLSNRFSMSKYSYFRRNDKQLLIHVRDMRVMY